MGGCQEGGARSPTQGWGSRRLGQEAEGRENLSSGGRTLVVMSPIGQEVEHRGGGSGWRVCK